MRGRRLEHRATVLGEPAVGQAAVVTPQKLRVRPARQRFPHPRSNRRQVSQQRRLARGKGV